MATVAKYKGSQYVLSGGQEHLEVEYDFANDGGATGSLDLFIPKEAMVCELAYLKVKTLCTSGGSATVAVGVSGGAGLVAATAVASLTAGAVIVPAAHPVKLAADAAVQLTIGTAALTAGKIIVVFKLSQF